MTGLVQAAREVKEAGTFGYLDAALPTSASSEQLENYLTSWQSQKVQQTAKYTDPAFVKAVERVQQMGKDGIFQEGYLGQSVTQSEANFVQQKAGMLGRSLIQAHAGTLASDPNLSMLCSLSL